jgi:hypothetical protein
MVAAIRALDVTDELSHAVETGDVEAVALLLPRVIDLDARNRHGTTMLMRAASCGHAQIVRLLLDHGADPNLMRNDKFTALALAAFFGHTETVKTLMEFGARTEDVTRSGASAHTWATARTYAEVARCLDTPRPQIQPQATIQSRRRSVRGRVVTLGVIATFVVIVCCAFGALVLSSSEARDLPPAPSLPPVSKVEPPKLEPPKVELPKVETEVITPPPPPATPKPVVNEEPRVTIRKTPARTREVKTLQVATEKPVAEVKISEPPAVVAKPKFDTPKPAALSPQILAPTKKAKVIQWP